MRPLRLDEALLPADDVLSDFDKALQRADKEVCDG